jgi:dsRNA-specific ribonuclease
MASIILNEIRKFVGLNFETIPIFQEAFNQNANQKIAEVGDCVLNLVVKEKAYKKPGSTSESINDAQKIEASKRRNQEMLNKDPEFTEFLKKMGCTSPIGNIGLDRADTFIEAVIGAVFLETNYDKAKKFTNKILELN